MHSLIHEHLAHATRAARALTAPAAESHHRDACEFGRPGCLRIVAGRLDREQARRALA